MVRGLAEAVARQLRILNTNTRYLNDLMLDLADRITARLPGDLKVAYFVNSGTEANELALRIARTALGRKDTIVLDWAYHGNSGGKCRMIDHFARHISAKLVDNFRILFYLRTENGTC